MELVQARAAHPLFSHPLLAVDADLCRLPRVPDDLWPGCEWQPPRIVRHARVKSLWSDHPELSTVERRSDRRVWRNQTVERIRRWRITFSRGLCFIPERLDRRSRVINMHPGFTDCLEDREIARHLTNLGWRDPDADRSDTRFDETPTPDSLQEMTTVIYPAGQIAAEIPVRMNLPATTTAKSVAEDVGNSGWPEDFEDEAEPCELGEAEIDLERDACSL